MIRGGGIPWSRKITGRGTLLKTEEKLHRSFLRTLRRGKGLSDKVRRLKQKKGTGEKVLASRVQVGNVCSQRGKEHYAVDARAKSKSPATKGGRGVEKTTSKEGNRKNNFSLNLGEGSGGKSIT